MNIPEDKHRVGSILSNTGRPNGRTGKMDECQPFEAIVCVQNLDNLFFFRTPCNKFFLFNVTFKFKVLL